MESLSERIQAVVTRCIERQNDPAFQENVRKLEAENADAAEVLARVERKHRLQASGVPYALWDSVGSPESTPAIDAVRTFLAGPADCVFLALAGPAGRGKTYAAAWAIAERCGRYATTHNLVAAGTFDPVWRELAAAEVLALDEVGAEYRNDAFAASLYSLLNDRHANGRRTILATNMDAGAFMARYCPDAKDPLRDRFRTASRWVNLPGESMRHHWSESDD